MKYWIFFVLILLTLYKCSKRSDIVEIFIVKSENLSSLEELDPQNVILDSLIISSNDIIAYDKLSFTFELTESSAMRLRKMESEMKPFCIIKNGEKVLAGWFWPCTSSLGMNGFVSFNLNCSGKNKLVIGYGLESKDYPNKNDPRKKITVANKN